MIKIRQNTTKYTTKSLRSFLSRVKNLEMEVNGYGARIGNYIYATGGKTRHDTASGEAYLKSDCINLVIGDNAPLERIAYVFLHELQHNRGYDHKQMNETMLKRWAQEMLSKLPVLEVKPPVVVTKIDMQEKRYVLAKGNLERALTRLKRAKTLFQKWNTKVKYYETVFANKRNG